jgi:DNA-binding SARP family transcriptional activator
MDIRDAPAAESPRFRILGPLQAANRAGAAVTIPQPLQRAALATLLAWDGAPCPREIMAAVLWGDSPPGDPPGALRTVMHSLRKLPGMDPESLQAQAGGYLLGVGEPDVDARVFRVLAATARQAWYAGNAAEAADLLEKALCLWRQPELEALPRAPALAGRRHLLLREHRDVQDMLADALLALGRLDAAIRFLRGILVREPGREHAWAQLVRALVASGDYAAAEGMLTRAQVLHAGASGMAPGPELAEVGREVMNDL